MSQGIQNRALGQGSPTAVPAILAAMLIALMSTGWKAAAASESSQAVVPSAVPTLKQVFSPPGQPDPNGDTGVLDCTAASETMVLEYLQAARHVSGTADYPTVRRILRGNTPAREGISVNTAADYTPSLTNGVASAQVQILTPATWQSVVTSDLNAGFPVVAGIADWRLLSNGSQLAGAYAHAIVVAGVGAGGVTYNDPWFGQQEHLSLQAFATAWGTPAGGYPSWVALRFSSQPTTPPAQPTTPPDWRNAKFTLQCDGVSPQPFTVQLHDGSATVAATPGSGYATFGLSLDAVTTGNLTGVAGTQTAVLINCQPAPTNNGFSFDEVQVLSGPGQVLGELPELLSPPPAPQLPIAAVYDVWGQPHYRGVLLRPDGQLGDGAFSSSHSYLALGRPALRAGKRVNPRVNSSSTMRATPPWEYFTAKPPKA